MRVRSRSRRIPIVLGVVVLGLVVAFACAWGARFLFLLLLGDEGPLPPEWRVPSVPAGASIVDKGEDCGSGGCNRRVTVRPPAGQSPAELAAGMGLTDWRIEPPTLLDPGYVSVSVEEREGLLVIHVGYR